MGHSWELLREYYKHGYEGKKIQEALKEYQSFEDWPWPLMWKNLVGDFPDAKFILTTRSSSQIWHDSHCRHIKRYPETKESNILVYGSSDPNNNKKSFVTKYEKHNEEVRRFCNKKPEQFIELTWGNGSGWQELCSFLNMQIPNIPFPHENSSKIPIEFKYFWMNKNQEALTLVLKKILRNPIRSKQYYMDLAYLINQAFFRNH